MYSSEDLERFYFQYQTEALPHGVSVEAFCLTNKVPYNLFSKWYKDTRKKVVEVQVDGLPSTPSATGPLQEEVLSKDKGSSPTELNPQVKIMVDIRMSNGLHLFQKNLSYRSLRKLVEKLEVLC